MITFLFAIVCAFRTVSAQFNPCVVSYDRSSCLTQCTSYFSNAPNNFAACDSQCFTCFAEPAVFTPSCSTSVCLDGSFACLGYSSYCFYPSISKCYCGICPGITTCGVDPPIQTSNVQQTSNFVPALTPKPVSEQVPEPILDATALPTSFLPAPTPEPTSEPTPKPTQESTALPTSIPTPTQLIPSPEGETGGSACIASNQIVTTRTQAKKLKDLVPGEFVMTDTGFKRYMGVIHQAKITNTFILNTNDNKSIEITKDHLVKTAEGFKHASAIKEGLYINQRSKVISIRSSTSHVMSPMTTSGTIVVNGIVLSCYAVVKYHHLANILLIPLRSGIYNNSTKYFQSMIKIYNILPTPAKKLLASNIEILF